MPTIKTHDNSMLVKNWLSMNFGPRIFSSFLITWIFLSCLIFSTIIFKTTILVWMWTFIYLTCQNCNSIETWWKLDQSDERMKTHVSKFSLGQKSSVFPSVKVKGHFCFRGGEVKNQKIGFSPYILEVEEFPYLSSDLKLVEQKQSYVNLKILVDSEIMV